MSLLDRYLASVRSALPEAQRDDIINELSENLRSQIEDQESSLGRPLTDAEVDAMLKQHGHPLIVAARYHQEQRSLSFGREIIGPVLFPFYSRSSSSISASPASLYSLCSLLCSSAAMASLPAAFSPRSAIRSSSSSRS